VQPACASLPSKRSGWMMPVRGKKRIDLLKPG
jgi:hypothetical protein